MSYLETIRSRVTAWKVSKYGVFSAPYFQDLNWIRENTDQKKLRIRTLFTQWVLNRDFLDFHITRQIRKQKEQHTRTKESSNSNFALQFIFWKNCRYISSNLHAIMKAHMLWLCGSNSVYYRTALQQTADILLEVSQIIYFLT